MDAMDPDLGQARLIHLPGAPQRFSLRDDCGRNSSLRLCRWVDPHFSNALELDGTVVWGERTLSLPRRSRSGRLQGAGEVSEYPGLRTASSEGKLDAACGLDNARAYLQKFFAQGHKFGDGERMGFGDSVTQFRASANRRRYAE